MDCSIRAVHTLHFKLKSVSCSMRDMSPELVKSYQQHAGCGRKDPVARLLAFQLLPV